MSSTQSLEVAAHDGSIDMSVSSESDVRLLKLHRAAWPSLLEDLLQRINDIVHNDFPIPQLPTAPSAAADRSASAPLLSASQQSSKENDAPTNDSSHESSHDPSHDSSLDTSSPLPPELLRSYRSSVRVLQRDFSRCPPYTIQRLAELVLQPQKHYRYLPAYLRALDRAVSVSSRVSDFPLPTGTANINGGFLTNGEPIEVNGIQEREGLGSDESLGGALLTPIPWLRNSNALAASQGEGEFHSERMDTIIGPNGAGSIETVSVTINGVPSASSAAHTSPNTSTPASPTLSEQSDASTNSSGSMSTEAQLREQGGVTQGELLRQEQEAGVVPVAQATSNRRPQTPSDYAAAAEQVDTPAADIPHARGPDVIGMEDTGLVQSSSGLDMEAAVGRSRSKSPQPPDEAVKDQDGDLGVAD